MLMAGLDSGAGSPGGLDSVDVRSSRETANAAPPTTTTAATIKIGTGLTEDDPPFDDDDPTEALLVPLPSSLAVVTTSTAVTVVASTMADVDSLTATLTLANGEESSACAVIALVRTPLETAVVMSLLNDEASAFSSSNPFAVISTESVKSIWIISDASDK